VIIHPHEEILGNNETADRTRIMNSR